MHYHCEVYLKNLSEDVEDQIEKAMSPYYEGLEVELIKEDDDEYYINPVGFWDWYQIGGRWTGTHDNYDPEKDPDNIEVCRLCNGTGTRSDMKVPNGCNGCIGTGKSIKWPTQWKRYDGDIVNVSEIREDLSCYTLIIPEVGIFHQEEWSENVPDKLKELNIVNGYLVTVDYHC